MKIFSGDRVRDVSTGFTGKCTGTDEQGGEVKRVLITSEALVPEGTKPPTMWVDISAIEKLEPRLTTHTGEAPARDAPAADARTSSAVMGAGKSPAPPGKSPGK